MKTVIQGGDLNDVVLFSKGVHNAHPYNVHTLTSKSRVLSLNP